MPSYCSHVLPWRPPLVQQVQAPPPPATLAEPDTQRLELDPSQTDQRHGGVESESDQKVYDCRRTDSPGVQLQYLPL